MVTMKFTEYERIINERFKDVILDYRLLKCDDYLGLYSLAIQPNKRNLGWGSAFLEDLIEFAEFECDEKFKGIQLQLDHKSREKLKKFYSKFGFVPVDDEKFEGIMRLDFIRRK